MVREYIRGGALVALLPALCPGVGGGVLTLVTRRRRRRD